MSLWIVYTCSIKRLEGVEKMGRRWMDVVCVIDQDHQRSAIVVDHFRKFKGI